ncbi:MAG TPA: phage major capsid protein [Thermoguttaceae bacterium]|nr:phage major capsid protein [Thermoguttaceae bacterium]
MVRRVVASRVKSTILHVIRSGQFTPACTRGWSATLAIFPPQPRPCPSRELVLDCRTTIPQLAQLSITIGTSGAHIPVMTSDNGSFQILTRPVVFTEKLPALGTLGDIILVDFSQYAIGIRQEMSVESSRHVGWQSDQTGYRCIIRIDGMPTWASAHTPKSGGDSLSWAVALESR